MSGMIDRLESPVADSRDVAHPPVALEYQPPQPRAARAGDMGWGLLISFFLAMGVGWFMFGALMMAGYRDDYAGPVALGAGFITMVAGTAAALTWTRRRQPNHHDAR